MITGATIEMCMEDKLLVRPKLLVERAGVWVTCPELDEVDA
jgi:hypothetical protein